MWGAGVKQRGHISGARFLPSKPPPPQKGLKLTNPLTPPPQDSLEMTRAQSLDTVKMASLELHDEEAQKKYHLSGVQQRKKIIIPDPQHVLWFQFHHD